MQLIRLILLSSSVFLFSNAAISQTFPAPNKPIRLIVGFAPGGGTDIVARALAPKIGEILGQSVIVETRSGAAGTIAADMVSKSAPDGHTLLMGHSNSNAIAPFVLAKVPYNAANDFSPITYVGYVPNILAINPNIPANTVAELVSLAKSKPGQFTYGSSGTGSTQHLAGALFGKISQIEINHIPYKGSGQAIIDLLAGQITMNFDTMPPVLEHIRAGKLRALAISTPKRLDLLSQVPTFSEVGIQGFDVTNWYAIIGPKGMAPEVVAKIDRAVRGAMSEPAIKATLDAQGLQTSGPSTPEAFGIFIKAELEKYSKMVKELNIKSE
jgi:tripartite-type tricarboxylate transporter receptor subunit TctC